jgi:hypothetical protein
MRIFGKEDTYPVVYTKDGMANLPRLRMYRTKRGMFSTYSDYDPFMSNPALTEQAVQSLYIPYPVRAGEYALDLGDSVWHASLPKMDGIPRYKGDRLVFNPKERALTLITRVGSIDISGQGWVLGAISRYGQEVTPNLAEYLFQFGLHVTGMGEQGYVKLFVPISGCAEAKNPNTVTIHIKALGGVPFGSVECVPYGDFIPHSNELGEQMVACLSPDGQGVDMLVPFTGDMDLSLYGFMCYLRDASMVLYYPLSNEVVSEVPCTQILITNIAPSEESPEEYLMKSTIAGAINRVKLFGRCSQEVVPSSLVGNFTPILTCRFVSLNLYDRENVNIFDSDYFVARLRHLFNEVSVGEFIVCSSPIFRDIIALEIPCTYKDKTVYTHAFDYKKICSDGVSETQYEEASILVSMQYTDGTSNLTAVRSNTGVKHHIAVSSLQGKTLAKVHIAPVTRAPFRYNASFEFSNFMMSKGAKENKYVPHVVTDKVRFPNNAVALLGFGEWVDTLEMGEVDTPVGGKSLSAILTQNVEEFSGDLVSNSEELLSSDTTVGMFIPCFSLSSMVVDNAKICLMSTRFVASTYEDLSVGNCGISTIQKDGQQGLFLRAQKAELIGAGYTGDYAGLVGYLRNVYGVQDKIYYALSSPITQNYPMAVKLPTYSGITIIRALGDGMSPLMHVWTNIAGSTEFVLKQTMIKGETNYLMYDDGDSLGVYGDEVILWKE